MDKNKYTYAQKRIVLISHISRLDNALINEPHEGNRHALQTELDVLREILKNLHDTQAPGDAP